MIIIITGGIGVGKTTVCKNIVSIAQHQEHSCGGILTFKMPDGDIIIEDIQTGRNEKLASPRPVYQGPSTPRYYFSPDGIKFGIQAIERGIHTDLLFVDEIGRLESRGEGFYRVIDLVKAGKVKCAILVIRQALLNIFLTRLASPHIFETTINNRDELPQEIWGFIASGESGIGIRDKVAESGQ